MDSSQLPLNDGSLLAELLRTASRSDELPDSEGGRVVRIRRCWDGPFAPDSSHRSGLALSSLESHLKDHSELQKSNDLVRPHGASISSYLSENSQLTSPIFARDVFVFNTTAKLPPLLWLKHEMKENDWVKAFWKHPHSRSAVYFNFELDTLQITTHASPLLGIIPKGDLARLRSLILPLQASSHCCTPRSPLLLKSFLFCFCG